MCNWCKIPIFESFCDHVLPVFPKELIPSFIFLFVEPKSVIDYLQTLKSSEESLREQVWCLLLFFFASKTNNLLCRISSMFCYCYQLEKAKKKEGAFIVTFAKREQEIAELKVRSLFSIHIYVISFWIYKPYSLAKQNLLEEKRNNLERSQNEEHNSSWMYWNLDNSHIVFMQSGSVCINVCES